MSINMPIIAVRCVAKRRLKWQKTN